MPNKKALGDSQCGDIHCIVGDLQSWSVSEGIPALKLLKWQPAGFEKISSMCLELAGKTECQASCPRSLQSLRSSSRHEMVLVLIPGLPDLEKGLMHLHGSEGCPDGSQSQALHLAMLG